LACRSFTLSISALVVEEILQFGLDDMSALMINVVFSVFIQEFMNLNLIKKQAATSN